MSVLAVYDTSAFALSNSEYRQVPFAGVIVPDADQVLQVENDADSKPSVIYNGSGFWLYTVSLHLTGPSGAIVETWLSLANTGQPDNQQAARTRCVISSDGVGDINLSGVILGQYAPRAAIHAGVVGSANGVDVRARYLQVSRAG